MTDSPIKAALRGTTIALAAFCAPLIATATPASAQDYPYYQPAPEDDILVEGRYGRVPDDAPSLSSVVHFGDLDLRYDEDRRILRQRISYTARDLCRRLGEHDTSVSIIPSCQQQATRDAWRRLGTRDQTLIPRDSAWLPSRGW